jgi:hypothetical protein
VTQFIGLMKRWIFYLWLALPLGLRAGDLDNSWLDGGVLRVTVKRVAGNFLEQFRAATATNFSSLVLDLRFADGDKRAAHAAEGFFLGEKFPFVILVNGQTRGAASQLASQLRAAGDGIVIGGTNGGVTPDVAVTVSAEAEKLFQADPFSVGNENPAPTLAATNAFLPLIDHTSEAELVRKKIKDGEDADGNDASPRAAPAAPVIRDPALARAVDLLKAVAVLKQARG